VGRERRRTLLGAGRAGPTPPLLSRKVTPVGHKSVSSRKAARPSRDAGGTRPGPGSWFQLRWLPAWAAALGGMLFVFLFTRGLGLGISPDSVSYLSAAESLAHGGRMLDYDGSIFSAWPPLLPFLLSLPTALGRRADQVAWLFQCVLYGGLLGFSVAWLRRRQASTVAVWMLAAAAVFAYPLLRSACTLWSELLFSALCLLTIERLSTFRHSGRVSAFWLAATAAALATLTRYVGVALISSGAIYLLVGRRETGRTRLLKSLLFGVAASLPSALWVLRNLRLGEGPTGPRHPAMLDWGQILHFLGRPLPRLFLGESWSGWLPDVAWLGVFMVLWAGLFAWSLSRRRSSTHEPCHGNASTGTPHVAASVEDPHGRAADEAFFLLLFCGIFFLLLALAISRSAMDRPNERLLAPTVLPALLALGLVTSSRRDQRRLRPAFAAVLSGLAVAVVAGLVHLPVHLHDFRTRDAVYALPRWQASPLAARLRQGTYQGRMLTNRPDAVFYLCGFRAPRSPREKGYQSHDLSIQYQELKEFERRVKMRGPRGGLFLAWFYDNPPFLLELSTLKHFYQVMQPVERLADGEILFIPYFEGTVLTGPPPR